MNQHVAPIERIDPETGEITEVSSSSTPADSQVEAVAVPETEKRRFPVQPVRKDPKPPLPTPAADRIDDNWGIARFATRGAMHLERYFVMSEKLLWPSILIALLSVALIFHAKSSIGGFAFSRDEGLMMFLPFFIVGCAGAFVFLYPNIDDPRLIAAGGLCNGAILATLWHGGSSDPNSTLAWVLFGVKTVVVIGLVFWIGYHILKIRRSGESRAILWMVGGYVFLVVVGTLILGSIATAMSGFGPGGMQVIQSMLTYDRDTYFNLGGGLRSGPEDRWMAEYAPQGGLSVLKLNALIKAVQTDIGNHGDDAANWEEVTKLQTQPMITRAEKAIRDNSKELPNGIIVLPKDGGPVSIVAHVEGQWSLSLITSQACVIVVGPYDEESGCQNETTPDRPLNSDARSILDEIKPTPAAETKE